MLFLSFHRRGNLFSSHDRTSSNHKLEFELELESAVPGLCLYSHQSLSVLSPLGGLNSTKGNSTETDIVIMMEMHLEERRNDLIGPFNSVTVLMSGLKTRVQLCLFLMLSMYFNCFYFLK